MSASTDISTPPENCPAHDNESKPSSEQPKAANQPLSASPLHGHKRVRSYFAPSISPDPFPQVGIGMRLTIADLFVVHWPVVTGHVPAVVLDKVDGHYHAYVKDFAKLKVDAGFENNGFLLECMGEGTQDPTAAMGSLMNRLLAMDYVGCRDVTGRSDTFTYRVALTAKIRDLVAALWLQTWRKHRLEIVVARIRSKQGDTMFVARVVDVKTNKALLEYMGAPEERRMQALNHLLRRLEIEKESRLGACDGASKRPNAVQRKEFVKSVG